METDTSATGAQNSGGEGGGAPTDVPAKPSAKTYSQEEFDTNSAKLKTAVSLEAAKKRDREWLEKLGVSSLDEAAERLRQVAEAQPKPKKSDAEVQAEKMTADFQRMLAEKDKALAEAQQAIKAEADRRGQEHLRNFILAQAGDTVDPELVVSRLTRLPYQASRWVDMHEGKVTVIEDGTPLPHIDPTDWVKEVLGKELHHRKVTSPGTGARVGAAPAVSSEPKPRNAIEARKSVSHSVVEALRNRGTGASGAR